MRYEHMIGFKLKIAQHARVLISESCLALIENKLVTKYR